MSDKYTLKEVHVEVHPGVTLTAEVSNFDGLISLLNDLKAKNLISLIDLKKRRDLDYVNKEKEDKGETPEGRIEVNAGIEKGSLAAKNVLAFKEGIPQLLRPSAFAKVTEAALVLLHAVEAGLKSPTTNYESFKGLFESQNLKSSTPLAMLLTNLRNSGYLDKKTYKDARKLRLSPKGDKKAIEIMKEMITQ
jgi:hypothetical protein